MNFYPVSKPDIGKDEIEIISSVVKSGWISSAGKYI